MMMMTTVSPRPARRPRPRPAVVRHRAPRPAWVVPVLTLLALAAILGLRRPGALSQPQFWAEDAVVLFSQARADGLWGTLFRPHPGYLLVGERLVAWGASFGPAAWAPGLYAWATLAAHLGVGSLLMRPRLRAVGGGPALALMTALVPHDGEILLRLLSLYWLAAPVVWMLILQDAPRTRWQALGDVALLVVAGLTGPFALLFLPLFLVRPWREGWTRYNLGLLGLAAAVAAAQGWFLAHHQPTPHPGPTWEPRAWLEALFHLPGSLLGGDALVRALGPAAWAFGGGVFVVATWIVFRVGERRGRLPAVVLAAGGLAAWVGGLAQHAWMPAALTASGSGGRYFYPAAIGVAWVALLLRRDRTPLVRGAGSLALALLVTAAVSGGFRAPPDPDVRWPEYARRVDAGEPGVVAPINPPGWTVAVPARRQP